MEIWQLLQALKEAANGVMTTVERWDLSGTLTIKRLTLPQL